MPAEYLPFLFHLGIALSYEMVSAEFPSDLSAEFPSTDEVARERVMFRAVWPLLNLTRNPV